MTDIAQDVTRPPEPTADDGLVSDETFALEPGSRPGRLRRLFRRGSAPGGPEDVEYGAPDPMPRGPRWNWPGPLGGPAAVLLITLVVLAVPVAVAAHWATAPPAPVAAPPAPAAPTHAAPTGPNYLAPVVPQPNTLPTDDPDLYGPPGPAPTPLPLSTVAPVAGQPGPSGAPAGSLPFLSSTPKPGSFVALTGAGCRDATTASYFAAYRAGTPISKGTGGWATNGCDGTFWSVPMSGSATEDDPETYVLWFFNTGSTSSRKCEVWTYVPKSPTALDAAGDPTVYQVVRSRDDQGVIGTFSVKQPAHRGTWVDGGSFAPEGGQIAVKLVNRGTGRNGARHAAGQVVVNCAP
jgi:hypothetical protein